MAKTITPDTADLRINGADALAIFGVRMGDGFLDNLTEPLSLKPFVENESRTEHGKRIVVDNPRFDSREVMLSFTIEGSTPEDLRDKKNLFLATMYSGRVEIEVPKDSPEIYRLIYTGKGSEYSRNTARTFCKMMLKFVEPNPANRGAAG